MAVPRRIKLGPYELGELIGAGGMGEVYRAHDPRLNRDVAVKVLPSSFSEDPQRLRRFELEARAAAGLNHPNILAIFDIGSQDGAPYIVSELLQGETLRHKLSSGPLPSRSAVDYAAQIGRALAAAHDQGIVHRDLKPENIFLTADGSLKLLDFGLAKLIAPSPDGSTQAQWGSSTSPGMILGTIGYMAPEQVRGLEIDARADLFAFGAVLYEMLSGLRAFQADTVADTMTAILTTDPPELAQANGQLPVGLHEIVRHCLEKKPKDRFQSAHDVVFSLGMVKAQSSRAVPMAGSPTLPRPREAKAAEVPIAERRLWKILLPAAVLVVAVAGTFYLRSRQSQNHLTDKDTIVLSEFANKTDDAVFDDTLKTALTVSLRQSPFLNLLSDSDVSDNLKLMTLPVGTKLTPEVARPLCLRANSKAYIAGTISQLGSSYVLEVKAVNCQGGNTLAEEQVTATSKERVLDTLGEAASKRRCNEGAIGVGEVALDSELSRLERISNSVAIFFSLSGGNKGNAPQSGMLIAARTVRTPEDDAGIREMTTIFCSAPPVYGGSFLCS